MSDSTQNIKNAILFVQDQIDRLNDDLESDQLSKAQLQSDTTARDGLVEAKGILQKQLDNSQSNRLKNALMHLLSIGKQVMLRNGDFYIDGERLLDCPVDDYAVKCNWDGRDVHVIAASRPSKKAVDALLTAADALRNIEFHSTNDKFWRDDAVERLLREAKLHKARLEEFEDSPEVKWEKSRAEHAACWLEDYRACMIGKTPDGKWNIAEPRKISHSQYEYPHVAHEIDNAAMIDFAAKRGWIEPASLKVDVPIEAVKASIDSPELYLRKRLAADWLVANGNNKSLARFGESKWLRYDAAKNNWVRIDVIAEALDAGWDEEVVEKPTLHTSIQVEVIGDRKLIDQLLS